MKKKYSQNAKGRLVYLKASDIPAATPHEMDKLRAGVGRRPDTRDIPEASGRELRAALTARQRRLASLNRGRKRRLTIYLDEDVVRAFRSAGPGYQSRINQALRLFLDDLGSSDTQSMLHSALGKIAAAMSVLSARPRRASGVR